MRTTLRIDDDLLTRLKSRARQESISLGRLVNRVLRVGLAVADRVEDTPAHVEQTFSMGEPMEELTGSLRLAAALEDEEALRKLTLRK